MQFYQSRDSRRAELTYLAAAPALCVYSDTARRAQN